MDAPKPRAPDAQTIDWSQLWYPGPRRAFTAEELAEAGQDGPSRTMQVMGAINVAAMVFFALQWCPPGETARCAGVMVYLIALGWLGARRLWWRPSRRNLFLVTLGLCAGILLLAFGIRWRVPERSERQALMYFLGTAGSVLPLLMWLLVMWRAQQIELRLAEQAERRKAVEMARRLAAAQVEPHFLFNTLASLQHWVQTQDPRAASLLTSLTGYLRATLPLFDRPLLPVRDEVVAVRRYLEVMQARLGSRLRFAIDLPEPLAATLLPPGLLLTLVENAVVHGIEPALAGGTVTVRAVQTPIDWRLTVEDDGVGLPADWQAGTGLSNLRERLALAYGADSGATCTLERLAPHGCRAALVLPLFTTTPTPMPTRMPTPVSEPAGGPRP